MAILVGCTPDQAAPPRDAAGGAGGTPSSGSGGETSIEQRLEEALSALDAPPFGPAAAASARDATTSASVALGEHHAGGPGTTVDTRFNVASVSKLLTAARVVSMAHEAKLALGDSIASHLPGVVLRDSSGVDQSGNITVSDLLRHRSGVPHVPPDLEAQVAGNWTQPELLSQITQSWEITLTTPPGSYQYSNLGYALLGAIVERVGGCVFATCMSDYLAALGMSRATFWPADLAAEQAAHGHVLVAGQTQTHAPTWYGSRYALPFNGLWTTMDDLAAFGQQLAAATDPSAPLHPMTLGDGHGLGPIHGERLGEASLEHDGSGPGFYAALVVLPASRVVVSIATNGGNEQADEVATFSNAVGAAVQAIAR